MTQQITMNLPPGDRTERVYKLEIRERGVGGGGVERGTVARGVPLPGTYTYKRG